MDKKMFLAIILSIAVLIGFQFFYTKTTPPVTKEDTKKEDIAKEPVKETKKAPEKPLAPIPQTHIQSAEKEVTVENDFYKAVFTSRGGTIKSIEFKKHEDKKGAPIILKGDAVLAPLSIGVDEGFQASNVNFNITGSNIKMGAGADTARLVFEYSSGQYSIKRTYTFHQNEYGIDLKDEVRGFDSYLITPGKDFGIYDKEDAEHFGPVILKDAERIEFTAKEVKEPKNFKEGIKWVAQEDKYFATIIVPKTRIENLKIWNKNGDALIALKMKGGENNYLVYAGPKEYYRLAKYDAGLEHIVDFGFFSILARPLFWFLVLLYGVVHNYGVAIIILTIVTRVPFIPLINKGQKSMKKLADIQPRMAEIREKYKSDPQRMQKELMELYKKHKVNPMGGCLPILLQLPVFFALYKVLLIAIEIRGAPFMLWITDLSAKDPYYILPVVMGITMVIQQRMTPSTMDPKQQKIMMFLPIVFTFMFLTFASGLVLYWLVNNILSIIQQFYINKKAVTVKK
jgi:YidC/Oxa1 family membrane protein insertase